MNENEATPINIAAMPVSFSLRMPSMNSSARRGGQFAGQAHGAFHEGALDQARTSHPGHAALREFGNAAAAARQQPVEGVDGGAHEFVFAAPPAFVAAQDTQRAGVFAP